jgi:superoxide dismutase, Fe-Mn family
MDTGHHATFKLPQLPYAHDALAPHLSAATLKEHHGAHHKTYVEKLNGLIEGTEFAGKPLEEIIRKTAGKKDKQQIFNNAAQHWNHTFFWHCMKPSADKKSGGGKMPDTLEKRIARDFGTPDAFKKAFLDQGATHFGSGWVWLIEDAGKLSVITTHDGDNPLAHGKTALITCDLWEHAYYLDYQHARPKFLQAFYEHLADWDSAAALLDDTEGKKLAQTMKDYVGA